MQPGPTRSYNILITHSKTDFCGRCLTSAIAMQTLALRHFGPVIKTGLLRHSSSETGTIWAALSVYTLFLLWVSLWIYFCFCNSCICFTCMCSPINAFSFFLSFNASQCFYLTINCQSRYDECSQYSSIGPFTRRRMKWPKSFEWTVLRGPVRCRKCVPYGPLGKEQR
jgi:hypothetical protein